MVTLREHPWNDVRVVFKTEKTRMFKSVLNVGFGLRQLLVLGIGVGALGVNEAQASQMG